LGYNIGDTVQFTLKPYRIIVSGRIKHYFCFGEHVIGKEVESALQEAMQEQMCVSMNLLSHSNNTSSGLPYHEWFIEFEQEPEDKSVFAEAIDNAQNKTSIMTT
jgi:hypothetical protein